LAIYRVKGELNHPPKHVIETLWSWGESEWQACDDIETWRKKADINDNLRIVYQVNKLPWPLWNRDFSLLMHRREDEGRHFLLFCSVEHPDIPNEEANKRQRAQVSISAFIMEPQGENKTKLTRILHVDPAGNIPKKIVNSHAKKVHDVIEDLNKKL